MQDLHWSLIVNEMINDCLNVENNIKKIDLTNKNIVNVKIFPK